jgi:8-oxo-dGTP pyrophosphatase MutT (NUDIX family)
MTQYEPSPVDTSEVILPETLNDLLEHLAENNHDVWAAHRIAQGWTFGPTRDDTAKRHPCLVPYAQLPESEKEYDRRSAAETLKAILTLGYRIIAPMSERTSEGGIAIVERHFAGRTEWLAQWNDNWKALFFIGGHRQPGESFRECVVREIQEELNLTLQEFTVAATPAHHVEYKAQSSSAGELTAYVMELFETQLSQSVLARVEQDTRNRWLSEGEIRGLEAHDARPISATIFVLLSLARRIQ